MIDDLIFKHKKTNYLVKRIEEDEESINILPTQECAVGEKQRVNQAGLCRSMDK